MLEYLLIYLMTSSKTDQYKLINLVSLHSSGCLLYKNI